SSDLKGTDCVSAINYLNYFYMGDDCEMVGCSVPATEHSCMVASGEDGEQDTFDRLMTEVYPNGIVSIVSDSYDFWRVLTQYLPHLKNIIMARDGKLVIRPDSGNPLLIICGDSSAPEGSPEFKGALQLLWETFGGTF